MQLREFISTTIVEILAGVQDAIDRTAAMKGAVNPVWGSESEISVEHLQAVQFDVAVTVTESARTEKGGELKVVGIGVGGESVKEAERAQVSRIQFSLPFIPPVQLVQSDTGAAGERNYG